MGGTGITGDFGASAHLLKAGSAMACLDISKNLV